MRAFSPLNTFVPAGVLSMGVWAVVPTGFPTGFELEAQPARQPTPRQKVTANVMVFIVLIVERTLSGIKLKLQFCFSRKQRHTQNDSLAERIRLHLVEVVLIPMNHAKIKAPASIASAALAGFIIIAGCAAPKTVPPQPATQTNVSPALMTQTNILLAPGPNDERIAYWTARLLEDFHYSQQLLDLGISEKFFDGYLETLDPRRENFLQSDIAEFTHYRTNLDTLTLGINGIADLTPAYEIYRRYLERIQQHADCVNELLQEDKFKFNTDEHILLDRRHAPYPKDLGEAQQLWRQRLRYEYLQEKLSREVSPPATNPVVMPPDISPQPTNEALVSTPKSAPTSIADTLARHYRWNLRMTTNWDST